MRVQKRPFVVEIRQKRGAIKRPPSIWSDVDLAGAADAMRSEAGEPTVGKTPTDEPTERGSWGPSGTNRLIWIGSSADLRKFP
jgi:hypothetical protein